MALQRRPHGSIIHLNLHLDARLEPVVGLARGGTR
jgi:hypothetical protein